MSIVSTAKRILGLTFIVPIVVFGQATLKGTLTDAANKETLIGVTVILEGTSLGAATNIEGQYRIAGIPERVFNVKFSCIGYESKIIEVDFSKNKDVVLDVQMTPTVIEGEEIVITGQMKGQIAAINQQVTSNTIVNVVSEEKIKELPDANAAEAIGRLPGVAIQRSGGEASKVVLRGMSSRFSNISIDGISIPGTDSLSKDVDLSMISQGSLAGIELSKTLTPDQDADAIAGSINLVTRKAPSERELKLDVKGGYNHIMKSTKQYDIAGRYAERFFDDVLGVQVVANVEKKIRSKENVQIDWTLVNRQSMPDWRPNELYAQNDYEINSVILDFTDEIRTRKGGTIIFDVNTPDGGSVKATGVYSSTKRDYTLYDMVRTGDNAFSNTYQIREIEIKSVNSSLQGNNYLLGLDVDWALSYAHSEIENPYDYSLSFDQTYTDYYGGDNVKDPVLYINSFRTDYSLQFCTLSTYRKQENFDKERVGRLNLKKPYTISDLLTGELKIGGKYKEKERSRLNQQWDENDYLSTDIALNNPDGSQKPFLGTPFQRVFLDPPGSIYEFRLQTYYMESPFATRDLFGKYRLEPMANPEAIKVWYEIIKNGGSGWGAGQFGPNGTAVMTNYDITERVSSAFLMNTLNIGQSVTVIAGIRVEQETNDYLGKITLGGIANTGFVLGLNSPVRDSVSRFSETTWLPNLQMSIRPTEYLTVRLAAYKALARPDYNLRLPSFYAYGTRLVMGNPNLKNPKAWNYEVNTQVHSSTLGLISISVFYKVIDDLYHTINTRFMRNISIDPDGLNYYLDELGVEWHRYQPYRDKIMLKSGLFPSGDLIRVYTSYNSPEPTYAWGFEFEHQLNFSFLPISFLKSVTLSYNISVTRSETNIYTEQFVNDAYVIYNTTTNTWINNNNNIYTLRLEKRQSEGQPNFYGNAALGYDIGGFSARLSFFFQDEYVELYSAAGTEDVYVDSFQKLDLSLKQEVSQYVVLFLNISNLTNVEETRSERNRRRGWNILRSAEIYGTTVDVGVKLTL